MDASHHQRQLALVEQVYEAALACARVAAIVLDARLTVLHATDSAAALLTPDSPLRLQHGRLSAAVGPGSPGLAQLVRAALPGPGRTPCAQALCLPRPGRPPLTLTVAPLPACAGVAPHVLLLLRAPEQATVAAGVLRQLYDLTPAEADVAKALAEGSSLEQFALAHRISINTVKTHLQRVYAKTATSRQGELVALLHGSAATYGAASGLAQTCDDAGASQPYTAATGRPHDRPATGQRGPHTASAPPHCDRSPT